MSKQNNDTAAAIERELGWRQDHINRLEAEYDAGLPALDERVHVVRERMQRRIDDARAAFAERSETLAALLSTP